MIDMGREAHMSQGSKFDFQKFLRRALDEDFVVVAGISLWIWIFSVLSIFFTARGNAMCGLSSFGNYLARNTSENRTIFSDAAFDLGRELDLTCEVGDV